MQKTLITQSPPEDDGLAGDADYTDNSMSSVSIGERSFSNFRFADDIDLLGGNEEELQQLAENPETTAA